MLSPKINQYIEDSKINGKLCRWNKSVISIFVTEITHQNVDKVFLYSEIQRAILLWNNTLHKNGININFEQINKLYENTKKPIEKDEAKIEPITYIDKNNISDEERKHYKNLGIEEIKKGKLAAVTMAGGQGTRLRT